MKLVSVNVGLPREVKWHGRIVTTGIFKEPVAGRVALRKLNLDGDRQADLTDELATLRCENSGASLAADSGENAKLAQDQHLHVYGLVVTNQASVPFLAIEASAVALDAKYHVFFMFEPPGVFHRDQELPGIVMHGHLLRSGGAPNPEISHRSLLAGKGLLLRNRIPFLALRDKGVSKSLPNEQRESDSRCPVLLAFVPQLIFRELCGEIFLRGLLGVFFPHLARLPGKLVYTTSTN